ncbi:hypothetical protein KYI92_05535 [Pantoea allii]|uniref:Uncharacterized protein n=1 Tax=Pantoea allii TaxID=574096 RepID=A0ABS6VBI5_9GAMM|nr:hypothetical protein [Pantoea allii]MBW1213012.1 hypothetical protein [Pantoea allii]MBW1256670.1 hypothetical protein [Pantoea allii]MBW1265684.1 hypothetical protein [Pantoea allii]MBW1287864.1 hypothetical protein [Pantoea allii]
MLNLIMNTLLISFLGLLSNMFVLFFASFIFYLFAHKKGTLGYFIKTFSIIVMTVPVAILLVLLLIYYIVWQKMILNIWCLIKNFNNKEDFFDDANFNSAEIIVHLIHGTFEKNAPWTQPDSEICKKINSLGINVAISRFSWDGKNTASARTRAAERLGKHLSDSPAKHNYIIAHSHGGAIVREMSHLRDDIAQKVCGVCLLSPPFIFRRKISRTSGSLVYLLDISGSLAIQAILAMVLYPLGLYNHDLSLIIFFISIFLELCLSKYCTKTISAELNRDESRETIRLNNVQIFHAIGDEADSGLRFVSSLHEGCFAIFSQLKKAAASHKRLVHWSAMLSYMIYVIAGIFFWVFSNDYKDWTYVCIAGLIFMLISHIWQWLKPSNDIPHVLTIAAMPVAISSFWLAVAKALAYGDLRLIFCPQIFVSSSETPAGKYNVEKFAPQSDGTLIHSTHSHHEAIKNVAEWLSSSEFERISKQH